MSGKSQPQGFNIESIREMYRKANDYASVAHTFGAANAQNSVTHTLGRPPVGWDVIRKNKAATLYSDASVFGTQSLFRIKSDVASVTAVLRIF